ncbi:MAG: hypothetical protein ACREOS_08035 [Candidatus Dormibacteraceae bacterium]
MNRWWRRATATGILLAIPAVAEAHVIGGSAGWTDELVCLVPALLLLGAVLYLGRDDRPKPGAKDKK